MNSVEYNNLGVVLSVIKYKEFQLANHCSICAVELNKSNDSREHVLPNAIGGKKVIWGFLCRSCNSETGEKWDSALCQQLAHFSLLFQVERDRGVPPAQVFTTADGQQIRVRSDGQLEKPKPTPPSVTKGREGVSVHVEARTEKEAKQMLHGKIRALKKEYPSATPKSMDSIELHHTKGYLDSPITVESAYGGITVGKSIVKSALAMVVDANVQSYECEYAIDFLNTDIPACFGFYYANDLVRNRPQGLPFHCVHVEGCSESGLIKGYVEYFGHIRYVLLLSSTHTGASFSNTYGINPLDGTEISIKVVVDLSEQDILNCYEFKKFDVEILKSALDSVMQTMVQRDRQRQQSKEIEEAVEIACNKLGISSNDEFTEENIKPFVSHLVEELLPFLTRNIKR